MGGLKSWLGFAGSMTGTGEMVRSVMIHYGQNPPSILTSLHCTA